MRLKRLILIILVLTLISGCFHKYSESEPEVLSFFELSEQEILLVVKVTDTLSTEYYPPDVTKICYGENNCIPWAYYYIHKAKVLDVLNGQFNSDEVTFAILSHADFIKEVKKEWYINLKRFKNQITIDKLGTKYYVEKHNYKGLRD